jgi:CheY-like chemotaxis protein
MDSGAPSFVPSRPPPPRPIILCVEDNENHLQLRKAVLERNGYSIIAAMDASSALQSLRDAPVCLVLSDHMLRGTTGVELAQQMKAIKPDVPIVLYSGNPPHTMRGIDCFVNKGEPVGEFLSIINDLIKRYCEII